MDDSEIILRLKKDDQSALERIISQYGADVAAVVCHQLGAFSSPEDVEELASDVFAALWRSRHKLKTDHIRGWLGATARNRARDFLRKQSLLTADEEDHIIVADDDVQRLMEAQERTRLVREALTALHTEDREIFLRRYYYNQSIGGISDAMSLNENTVKTRLARGRRKLKEILIQGGYIHEG